MELALGELAIPKELVFWKKQFVFCIIPVLQVLKGHVLVIPRRQVHNISQLQTVEVFELSLTIRLVSAMIERIFKAGSSTVQVHNVRRGEGLSHAVVHVIPRVQGDLKKNDEIYSLLKGYQKKFSEEYNRTLALSMYNQKTLNAFKEESAKYSELLNKMVEAEKPEHMA